jgi:hypothetical protein
MCILCCAPLLNVYKTHLFTIYYLTLFAGVNIILTIFKLCMYYTVYVYEVYVMNIINTLENAKQMCCLLYSLYALFNDEHNMTKRDLKICTKANSNE